MAGDLGGGGLYKVKLFDRGLDLILNLFFIHAS